MSTGRKIRWITGTLLTCLSPLTLSPAWAVNAAGAPAGPAFSASAPGTPVADPAAATVSGVGSVIAWVERRQGGDVLLARRYDAAGTAGAIVRVDAVDGQLAVTPALAMRADGAFVIAWYRDGGSAPVVMARSFAANGQPKAEPVMLVDASQTYSAYSGLALALHGAGQMTLFWPTAQSPSRNTRVVGRRFAADGTPVAPAFEVDPGNFGTGPHAGTDAVGNSVLVWSGLQAHTAVFLRRFNAADESLGPVQPFVSSAFKVSLGVAADGSFVIASNGGGATYVQRYAADATPVGEQMRIGKLNASTGDPAVAASTRGFVACWTGTERQDSSGQWRIARLAQRFDAGGVPQSAPFELAAESYFLGGFAAMGADGSALLGWLPASNMPVSARRYAAIEDVDLRLASRSTLRSDGNIEQLFSLLNAHAADGGGVATGLHLKQQLPAGAAFVSATGAGWKCSAQSAKVDCTRSALPAAASSRVTLVFRGGTSAAAALVLAEGPDPKPANNCYGPATPDCATPVTIGFAEAASAHAETAGTAHLILQLSAPAPQELTIPYALFSGYYVNEAVDYRLPVGTLTIPAGATSASIDLDVLDDALDEDGEHLWIALAPAGGVAVSSVLHDFTIVDDDPAPTVSFRKRAQVVQESAGWTRPAGPNHVPQYNLVVQLDLSAPAGSPIRVDLRRSGTITDDDIQLGTNSVTFYPGSTDAEAMFLIPYEGTIEPPETMILELVPGHSQPKGITRDVIVVLDGD
jgi:hypothetical protein